VILALVAFALALFFGCRWSGGYQSRSRLDTICGGGLFFFAIPAVPACANLGIW